MVNLNVFKIYQNTSAIVMSIGFRRSVALVVLGFPQRNCGEILVPFDSSSGDVYEEISHS